jgi:hypothetical protein
MAYMERMDAYTLMNTKIMDRIMKELWVTDIDTSGSWLDQSSSYTLLRDPQKEHEMRFYRDRSLSTTRAHFFIFENWKRSIRVRYRIESFIYLVLSLLLQYYMIGTFSLIRNIRISIVLLREAIALNEPDEDLALFR